MPESEIKFGIEGRMAFNKARILQLRNDTIVHKQALEIIGAETWVYLRDEAALENKADNASPLFQANKALHPRGRNR